MNKEDLEAINKLNHLECFKVGYKKGRTQILEKVKEKFDNRLLEIDIEIGRRIHINQTGGDRMTGLNWSEMGINHLQERRRELNELLSKLEDDEGKGK